MNQEMEVILRRSLDDVDRARRWQIVGLSVLVCLFFLMGLSNILTFNKAHVPFEIRAIVITVLEVVPFTAAFCTFGVCLFITRMTRKILKAIELLSKERQ
jgi:hypothetical protein